MQFQLKDNTPSNHLVGSLSSVKNLEYPLARAMLSPDSLFKLTTNGNLFTRNALDRDEICGQFRCCDSPVCHIGMEAYLFDSKSIPMAVNIDVIISDENDNAPSFPISNSRLQSTLEHVWELYVSESAPVGSRYPLLMAIDRDSPSYGVQNYKLLSARSETDNFIVSGLPFSLIVPTHVSNGIKHLNAPELQLDRVLDRETKTVYEFVLVAEDASPFSRNASLPIRVTVQDVNDNAPVFLNLSSDAILKIPEDIPTGSVIHQFSASDPDEGVNGAVIFSLEWSSFYSSQNQSTIHRLGSKYAINPRTGEVRVTMPLDYENDFERRFVLTAKAVDQGSPKLTASASLTVCLIDVNDNSPEIEVLDVDASTEDIGKGARAQVLLHENDPTPMLLKMISVSDLDSVSSGQVSCRLADQYTGDFRLVSYSETMYGLTNARSFDFEREVSQTGHLAARLACFDMADPPRTTQHWIQIPLADVNDNWPQFVQANYRIHVSEDTSVDSVIGQVSAFDADSGSWGTVTYQLTTDDANLLKYLKIDSETGIIRTSSKFDRELLDIMEYHVTAGDGGDVALRSHGEIAGLKFPHDRKTNTTSLTVIVLDVNDNPPVYAGPTEIHLHENVPRGTELILSPGFLDPDLGENGTVHLTILAVFMQTAEKLTAWHSPPFKILNSSRLLTCGDIDRERHQRIIVALLAEDQGNALHLSSTVSLTVMVDDLNDNAPYLVHPQNTELFPLTMNSTVAVPLNSPAYTRVITIRASDADAGDNGRVTYQLLGEERTDEIDESRNGFPERIERDFIKTEFFAGSSHFSIDEYTGEVITLWGEESATLLDTFDAHNNTTGKRFQRLLLQPTPSIGLYILHLKLTDCGTPALSSRATIYLNVTDDAEDSWLLSLFATNSMSSTILLVFIVACLIVLTTGIVAAIMWVRHRKDGAGTTGHPLSTYTGPSVGCHNAISNGYYYPVNCSTSVSLKDLDKQRTWTGFYEGASYPYEDKCYTEPSNNPNNYSTFTQKRHHSSTIDPGINWYNSSAIEFNKPEADGQYIFQTAHDHAEPEQFLLSEPYASQPVMDLQLVQDFSTPGGCGWIDNYPAANDNGGGSDSGVDCGNDIVRTFVGQILDEQVLNTDAILTPCHDPNSASRAAQYTTQNSSHLPVFIYNTNKLMQTISGQTTEKPLRGKYVLKS
ncbi:unnamed protein product [Dicrocoelium dendriticum]|nr:unnamed protein product [Dicrocoelium dendriticum]